MSDTNPTGTPARRALDPVIEARVARIQLDADKATGVIESVRAVLNAHHCDRLADGTALIDLSNALNLALAELATVTDRLDVVNLADPSRRVDVQSTGLEELVDAA